MGRETAQIRRDISETRQEIDTHLQQLGGRVERVRAGMDIQARARENLPQLIGGAAIFGLVLGLLAGRRRRRHYYFGPGMAAEEARLAREWRRLAKERQRLGKTTTLAEITGEEEIP